VSASKDAVALNCGLGNALNIFYKKNKNEFLWAWEESRNKNVWGKAKTIKEIKHRAKRMFPNERLNYILV
jgi:hypothetical protein